jgi:putative transposase
VTRTFWSTLLGRKNRFASARYAHHIVNRGNDRRTIFRQDFDYAAFLELLSEGMRSFDVRVYGYCLMPNHFHLVAQPGEDNELSAFMQRVTGRYACAFRRQTETVGHGHVFQRRFWNVALHDDRAFVAVLRYVEANPCRASLVGRAEDWQWSSLRERSGARGILSPSPVALPPQWTAFVNMPQPDGLLSRIRRLTVPAAGRALSGDALQRGVLES